MADSKKASHTALMAAIHRFLATKEEDPSFQGADHLAGIFLPAKVKFFLSFKFIRKSVKKKMLRLVPGTYPYVTARTRYFDKVVNDALEEKLPQLILLGAGYDTRAIRFKAKLGNTQIFELDESAIQAQKKKLLQKAAIELPNGLKFASIDFHADDLHNVLKKAGYDPTKKTLFLWEGVSMYLEEKAVTDMLTFVAKNSGPGSSIAFDYFDKAILEENFDSYGAKEIATEVKKSGEPFKFGIDPQKIELFTRDHGFRLVSHITPGKMEKDYLVNDNGILLGQVYGFAYQVVAETAH